MSRLKELARKLDRWWIKNIEIQGTVCPGSSKRIRHPGYGRISRVSIYEEIDSFDSSQPVYYWVTVNWVGRLAWSGYFRDLDEGLDAYYYYIDQVKQAGVVDDIHFLASPKGGYKITNHVEWARKKQERAEWGVYD